MSGRTGAERSLPLAVNLPAVNLTVTSGAVFLGPPPSPTAYCPTAGVQVVSPCVSTSCTNETALARNLPFAWQV